jgi:hypothetical protein
MELYYWSISIHNIFFFIYNNIYIYTYGYVLIARYENVHKLLDVMLKFVWVLKALWGPSCYVMFSTLLEVERWLDYPKNTIVFIKKNLDKLLVSTKAQT